MKKVILFSALAVTGFISQAQTMFGVQAGANFASATAKSGSVSSSYDTKVGFLIGGVADVPFGGSISFRPELNFIQKGGKNTDTQTFGGYTTTSKDEATLNYIQLSPNCVYNIAAGKGKVFLGLGPEFAFGLSGKIKGTSTVTGPGINQSESDKADIKFDGDQNSTDANYHLKRFDFGANFIAGYKMANGLFISTGYTAGLANISPYNNEEFKNRGFHLNLGYMFGGGMMKK